MQTVAKDSPRAGAQDSRRARRYRSKIEVTVEFAGRRISGRLYDLSETGLSLNLDHAFFAGSGAAITIKSKEIGVINAVVRWAKDRRVGASFSQSSASMAQVKAYFRFFHKDVVGNS
ncbi:PilZ domain-containing protein [Rhizobium leguminosarum]|uniref:PilZ domain-containing protein n=1 Tax=Rhizobium leguminosarum TaxID=384 RepID=UPI002E104D8F|nr:PilZ domain-containing protein [Rhizobium leguminosarum]